MMKWVSAGMSLVSVRLKLCQEWRRVCAFSLGQGLHTCTQPLTTETTVIKLILTHFRMSSVCVCVREGKIKKAVSTAVDTNYSLIKCA